MTTSRAARVMRAGVAGLCLTALPIASEVPAFATPRAFETAAGASAARADTSIRFLSFDSVRRYGSATIIRGQVAATVNGTTGAVAGVHVRLFRRLNGSSNWVHLQTRRTTKSAFPHFRFRVNSAGNARYRVRFRGNSSLQPSHNQTYVRVYRAITGRIEDRTGRFHGRVTPHYAHRTVHLAKRSCARCSWERLRTDKTGKHGRYSFRVGAPSRGRWFWRVSTPQSSRFIRSFSAVFTTRLR
jgi:hypothetical protein